MREIASSLGSELDLYIKVHLEGRISTFRAYKVKVEQIWWKLTPQLVM